MTDDIFDFGFTAVDETELEVVQKAHSDLTDLNHTAEDAQGKLDRLTMRSHHCSTTLRQTQRKNTFFGQTALKKLNSLRTNCLTFTTIDVILVRRKYIIEE